jgi:hypothetical protein
MMRNFKVPVGMTQQEIDKATAYFEQKQNKEKKWWQRKKKMQIDPSLSNKNSKVIYLMGPENQFL